MPQITDITVKKADGSTDITYTALNPAGGDGIPAIFRSQTVGASPAARPEIRVSAKATKTGRQIRLTGQYPTVVTSGGVDTITRGTRIGLTIDLENAQGQAQIDEAVVQMLNVCASTLVKECGKTGFPPV